MRTLEQIEAEWEAKEQEIAQHWETCPPLRDPRGEAWRNRFFRLLKERNALRSLYRERVLREEGK